MTAALWRARAAARRIVFGPPRNCRCGHTAHAHMWYRPLTPRGGRARARLICLHCPCDRYRRESVSQLIDRLLRDQ